MTGSPEGVKHAVDAGAVRMLVGAAKLVERTSVKPLLDVTPEGS